MKAVVARPGHLIVEGDVPEPIPGKGQVLVRTLACGICGSDLHALGHLQTMAVAGGTTAHTGQLDLLRGLAP